MYLNQFDDMHIFVHIYLVQHCLGNLMCIVFSGRLHLHVVTFALFYSVLLCRIDKCLEEALSLVLLWYYTLEKRLLLGLEER